MSTETDPNVPIRRVPIGDSLVEPGGATLQPWTARLVSSRWWTVLLRGIAAVVLGVISLLIPGVTFLSLVLVFGVYAVVDGALSMAIGRRIGGPFWVTGIFRGVVGIVAGLVALLWPAITALVLLFVIAGWALTTGIVEIYVAIRDRKVLRHEWLLALQGILGIGFGILLFIAPAAGALAIGLWVGAYALVLGGILIASSLQLRKVQHEVPHTLAPAM